MSDRRAREAAYAAAPSRVHVGYGRPQHAPQPRPPRSALHNTIELSSPQTDACHQSVFQAYSSCSFVEQKASFCELSLICYLHAVGLIKACLQFANVLSSQQAEQQSRGHHLQVNHKLPCMTLCNGPCADMLLFWVQCSLG